MRHPDETRPEWVIRAGHLILVGAFVLLGSSWLYAGLVSRPTKTCGTTTYDAEVAAGCTTIKSNEVDADLNAIITGGVNNIETANVNAAGLGTAAIANGAITSPKIAVGGVTSGNILDGTIVNADVAAGAAIVGSKLADAPSGITTNKINDLQVTSDKLSVGATQADFGGPGLVGTGLSTSSGSGELTIATVAVTTRGGPVLLTGHASLLYTSIGAATGVLQLRIRENGTIRLSNQYTVAVDGAEVVPVPSQDALFLTSTVAGLNTYTVTIEFVSGTGTAFGTPAASAGAYIVLELS